MATIIPLFSIPLTKASRQEAPMTIQISSTFSERNVQKNPAFSSANTSPGASSPPVRTKYFTAAPQNSALTPIFLKNCELLELKLLLQNNFRCKTLKKELPGNRQLQTRENCTLIFLKIGFVFLRVNTLLILQLTHTPLFPVQFLLVSYLVRFL